MFKTPANAGVFYPARIMPRITRIDDYQSFIMLKNKVLLPL